LARLTHVPLCAPHESGETSCPEGSMATIVKRRAPTSD
jgi:hypothetical protein